MVCEKVRRKNSFNMSVVNIIDGMTQLAPRYANVCYQLAMDYSRFIRNFRLSLLLRS